MKKTSLILLLFIPLLSFGQFSKSLKEMQANKSPKYENYESLIFKATNYIFKNPSDRSSTEYVSAMKIVSFWMKIDTGIGIPTFGKFFTSLTNKDYQQYLYTVAIIHYGIDQKVNHNRVLKCKPIKGQKYSEQLDVKEVQLEGAKILLKYIGNKKNNVPMNSETKKYYKKFKKNKLSEIFFKK